MVEAATALLADGRSILLPKGTTATIVAESVTTVATATITRKKRRNKKKVQFQTLSFSFHLFFSNQCNQIQNIRIS